MIKFEACCVYTTLHCLGELLKNCLRLVVMICDKLQNLFVVAHISFNHESYFSSSNLRFIWDLEFDALKMELGVLSLCNMFHKLRLACRSHTKNWTCKLASWRKYVLLSLFSLESQSYLPFLY